MTVGPGLQQLHSSSPRGSDSTALLPHFLHPSPTAPRSLVSPILRVSACNPVCVRAHVRRVVGLVGVSLSISLCVSLLFVYLSVSVSLHPPLSVDFCLCLPLSYLSVEKSALVPVKPCLSGPFRVSPCLSMPLDLSVSLRVSPCLSVSLQVSPCLSLGLSVSLGVSPCLSGSLRVSPGLSKSVSPPPSVPLLQWNIDQPGLLCLASSQNICL